MIQATVVAHFNPRSPHGERRNNGGLYCFFCTDFNPRSPHGERRLSTEIMHGDKTISIHAPRTGSDEGALKPGSLVKQFQSTLPARGATSTVSATAHASTHFNPRSPHGERPVHRCRFLPQIHFNPRSPHGERLIPESHERRIKNISIHAPRTGSDMNPVEIAARFMAFQSTLPARGATFSFVREFFN